MTERRMEQLMESVVTSDKFNQEDEDNEMKRRRRSKRLLTKYDSRKNGMNNSVQENNSLVFFC